MRRSLERLELTMGAQCLMSYWRNESDDPFPYLEARRARAQKKRLMDIMRSVYSRPGELKRELTPCPGTRFARQRRGS